MEKVIAPSLKNERFNCTYTDCCFLFNFDDMNPQPGKVLKDPAAPFCQLTRAVPRLPMHKAGKACADRSVPGF